MNFSRVLRSLSTDQTIYTTTFTDGKTTENQHQHHQLYLNWSTSELVTTYISGKNSFLKPKAKFNIEACSLKLLSPPTPTTPTTRKDCFRANNMDELSPIFKRNAQSLRNIAKQQVLMSFTMKQLQKGLPVRLPQRLQIELGVI